MGRTPTLFRVMNKTFDSETKQKRDWYAWANGSNVASAAAWFVSRDPDTWAAPYSPPSPASRNRLASGSARHPVDSFYGDDDWCGFGCVPAPLARAHETALTRFRGLPPRPRISPRLMSGNPPDWPLRKALVAAGGWVLDRPETPIFFEPWTLFVQCAPHTP